MEKYSSSSGLKRTVFAHPTVCARLFQSLWSSCFISNVMQRTAGWFLTVHQGLSLWKWKGQLSPKPSFWGMLGVNAWMWMVGWWLYQTHMKDIKVPAQLRCFLCLVYHGTWLFLLQWKSWKNERWWSFFKGVWSHFVHMCARSVAYVFFWCDSVDIM